MVPPPASSVPTRVIGDGQLGQGLPQVSARIGYVLCHRARPSPQMLGDHPVRPSFETSDKRLYVVSPAFRRSPSGSVPPCTRVRAACPAPGGSPATSSGHPAGRTRFRRRCSSVALRVATAHSNPLLSQAG